MVTAVSLLEIAEWLLARLSTQWDFDNEDLVDDEIDPAWAQLHYDVAEFLPGI